ncbi:hypothetical protein EAI28_07765 [Faecalicatena contorta]|uniref:hypothetical protein n=1 Tax=Faecalicatena contorta TaxID=39482 RepID=UPI00129E950A|nr:hypothetical protein [Faecalicatena contorta]MRM88256.1 hypothetical protein [Faecalicatena contorta]
MVNDVKILRTLAAQYAQIAFSDHQKDMYELHASVNDLHPERPIVLMNELPWSELNYDGSLTLLCQDEDFRMLEDELRKTLFQWKHFPADMLVKPYLSVEKKIHSTGMGLTVQEERLSSDPDNDIVSHKYKEQIRDMHDIDRLHPPVIRYDQEKTLRIFYKIAEAVGDIIPVKITGSDTGYMLGLITWDIIAQYMDIDTLLYNLIDEPEFMHALVSRLTDIFTETIRQYEDLNLLNPDSAYVHCSCAASKTLRDGIGDYEHITAGNVWGRGLAQIFSNVSPQMHDEFEIQYAKEALAPFGFVYYGCCEPLDTKIELLRQIPNLRKISISPWADVNAAAEKIGRDYVLSAKPSPTNVISAASNPDLIRSELSEILRACERNHCPAEILLKDISTVGHRLDHLITWERIAMELVNNGL